MNLFALTPQDRRNAAGSRCKEHKPLESYYFLNRECKNQLTHGCMGCDADNLRFTATEEEVNRVLAGGM